MKLLYLLLAVFGILHDARAQFHLYPSSDNQIAQTIIQTQDGGFLLASIAFCYTPDEWVIEGCPTGIYLVKTDDQGATVWSRHISNYDILGPISLFEQSNGSFTIIASQDNIYQCHEWTIGPDFGLPQIIVYHINAIGETLHEAAFSDDCQLLLQDVERLSDSSFAVLAVYSEPFASEYIEGRLFEMNHRGVISKTITFPGVPLIHGDLAVDSTHGIHLFYNDTNVVVRLNTYDTSLNLLSEKTNASLGSTCLSNEYNTVGIDLLPDGNIFVMCHDPFGKSNNVDLFNFNRELQLLSNRQYSLPYAAAFTQTNAGEIVVVSENHAQGDSSDIMLSYFTLSGDSIHSDTYDIPGFQDPYLVLHVQGDDVIVAGSHNCCNLNASIGPGSAFILFAETSTSVTEEDTTPSVHIFPNPAHDFIHVVLKAPSLGSSQNPEVYLYSIQGILLKKQRLENNRISLEHLSPGIYFVEIRMEGKTIHHEMVTRLF